MTLFLASLALAAFVILVLSIPRRIDPIPDLEVTEPEREPLVIPFKAGMPRFERGPRGRIVKNLVVGPKDDKGRFTKVGR